MKLLGKRTYKKTCLAIGEFSITWALFENVRCNKSFSAGLEILPDIGMTNEELVQSTLRLKNLLLEDQARIRQTTNQELSVVERLLLRQNEEHYLQPIQDFLSRENFSEKDIVACVYIGARFRNNLLHGEKNIQLLNGQIEMFKELTTFFTLIIQHGGIKVRKKDNNASVLGG